MSVLLGLGACVSAPTGPSFVALPGKDKTYEVFQHEDNYCRQTAFGRSGASAQSPGHSTATGAVAGTLLGAGAGALLGAAVGDPGFGAAAGAGTGLVAGTAVGANNAAAESGGTQLSYDATYAQCMAAYGNRVPSPDEIVRANSYANSAYYAYPAYSYAYPTYGYAGYGYGYPGYGYGYGYPGWGLGGIGIGFGGFYGGGFRERGFDHDDFRHGDFHHEGFHGGGHDRH